MTDRAVFAAAKWCWWWCDGGDDGAGSNGGAGVVVVVVQVMVSSEAGWRWLLQGVRWRGDGSNGGVGVSGKTSLHFFPLLLPLTSLPGWVTCLPGRPVR